MIRRSVFVYIAAVVLLLCGIVLPEILSVSQSDYSSLANYISELGADGASTQRLINTLLFPMVGISLCLLYTSPSPRDLSTSRMPSSA